MRHSVLGSSVYFRYSVIWCSTDNVVPFMLTFAVAKCATFFTQNSNPIIVYSVANDSMFLTIHLQS